MSPSQFSHFLSYSAAHLIPFSAFFSSLHSVCEWYQTIQNLPKHISASIYHSTSISLILVTEMLLELSPLFIFLLYFNISILFTHLHTYYSWKPQTYTETVIIILSLCYNNSIFFLCLLSYRVILSIIILFLLLNKIRYVWPLIYDLFYCTEKKIKNKKKADRNYHHLILSHLFPPASVDAASVPSSFHTSHSASSDRQTKKISSNSNS